VSTVLDYTAELNDGGRVEADCPRCAANQKWWIPGNPGPIGVDPKHDHEGLTCWRTNCGYEVVFGPPVILCAICGLALEQHDHGFRCAPCGREVRP
jgi:hypothetical protein